MSYIVDQVMQFREPIKRILGLTGGVVQGDKAGYLYKLGASAVMADPGVGWMRITPGGVVVGPDTFVNLTVGGTGFIAVSKQNFAGTNISGILAEWNADDEIDIKSAENIGTESALLKITTVEVMDSGAWYKYGYLVKSTTPNLTCFKQFALNITKIVGLTEMRQQGVPVYDAFGNLLDSSGTIISGIEYGTYANMVAKNPIDYDREYFHVTDFGVRGAGLRYRANGTVGQEEWGLFDGRQPLANEFVNMGCIFPQTQATAISSGTGGKVRITAVGHLLTQAIAVQAGVDIRVSITAWSGTGTAGWYKVLAVVDADSYEIDLTYAAGLGTPTVTLKGTDATLPFSVNMPPLNKNSEVRVFAKTFYTGSATAKNFKLYLDGTANRLINITINTATQITAGLIAGFFNQNDKAKQETLLTEFTQNDIGSTTAAAKTLAVDTSVSKVLTFAVQATTANEVVGVARIYVTLEF